LPSFFLITTGTAALLNVGNSLRNLFQEMGRQGYDVNGFGSDILDGIV
jgi:cobalamin biosynthesis Mg chelatase CobN